ncbi:type IV pilus assembly protein PilM [Paraglaciecola aquimarina]|uniref:Type IV pilus assembly protein PilM n=1 Tax=Paraglaciecola aquimarina TaxID=1235557 RepID=A0ABU3SS00_9ALTE|nr:type IV pilus assembly protein PilM [Paraglaciecola aquimarina]MDU0352787.1 type IV pilus assembly protein PilM [Paraglaciecola aquimarina]
MHLFSPKPQQIIGLDIGTRFIKAVSLEKAKEHITLSGFACEPISSHAFNEREIKDFEAVSHALKKVKSSLGSNNNLVVIAVSGSTVLNKTVCIDAPQTDYELENQIELEADSLIPYPFDQVYIDFEKLEINKANDDKVAVLLSAVHKDIVDRRTTLLAEVGYETKIVDLESYALGTAVAALYPSQNTDNISCINIGATQLQFCTLCNGQVIFTQEHHFGVDPLIENLIEQYNQTRVQIESQLKDNSLPTQWKQQAYSLFLDTLQQHIDKIIQVYVSSTGANRPDSLLISGGAGHLDNLAKDLSAEFGIEFIAFNPFHSMTIDHSISVTELAKVTPQMAIAAGLAYRGFQPWHI